MAGQRLKIANHWFEANKDLFKKGGHWFEVESKFYKHAGHWFDVSTTSKGFTAIFESSTIQKIASENQEEFDTLFIEALEKQLGQPKITLTYEE